MRELRGDQFLDLVFLKLPHAQSHRHRVARQLEAPAELRRLATDGPIYDVLPYRGWLFVAASERGILAAPAERDPPGWRRYRCDGGAAS